MVTGRHRSRTRLGVSAAFLVAAAVGAGCSSTETSDPMQQRDRDASPDAPEVGGHGRDAASGRDASAAIAAALDARATNDPQAFVMLIDEAGAACADPAAQNRLDELGVLAERWADAVADGRPKVQAVSERQLSAADWDGLAEACSSV
jgi:hypothetical protein